MIKTCICCGKQFEADEPRYNMIITGRGSGKTMIQLNYMIKENCCSETCRVIMLKEVTSDLPNVSVECFGGLLVDFVKAKGSNIIVRGVRAMADFNIELQMAQTNRAVANDIDTRLP